MLGIHTDRGHQLSPGVRSPGPDSTHAGSGFERTLHAPSARNAATDLKASCRWSMVGSERESRSLVLDGGRARGRDPDELDRRWPDLVSALPVRSPRRDRGLRLCKPRVRWSKPHKGYRDPLRRLAGSRRAFSALADPLCPGHEGRLPTRRRVLLRSPNCQVPMAHNATRLDLRGE